MTADRTPQPDAKKSAHDIQATEKSDPKSGTQTAAEYFHQDFVAAVNSGLTPQNFRAGMVRELGEAKVTQLEMTWAAGHSQLFPHEMTGSRKKGFHPTENINGLGLDKFDPKLSDKGEKAFEQDIAQRLSEYVKGTGMFHGWNITPQEIQGRITALGSEVPQQQQALADGRLLAGSAGMVNGKPVTLLDRLTGGKGDYIDYSHGGQLDQLYAAANGNAAKPDWMTPEQANLIGRIHDYYSHPTNVTDKEMNQLLNSDYGVKKSAAKAAGVPSFDDFKPTADAPVQPAAQTQPGKLDGNTAGNAMDALMTLPKDSKAFVNGDNGAMITPQSLNDALGQTNLTESQRAALQALKDKWPANTASLSMPDIELAAGKMKDGKLDPQMVVDHRGRLDQQGQQLLGGITNQITEASITGRDGRITPDSIAAALKDAPKDSDQAKALQALKDHFKDISRGNGEITKADLDSFASTHGQDKFAGFKAGPAVPLPTELSPGQLGQADNFQFDTTIRTAQMKPGQSLYQFAESTLPKGSPHTNEDVYRRIDQIAVANGFRSSNLSKDQHHFTPADLTSDLRDKPWPKDWKIPPMNSQAQNQGEAEKIVKPVDQQLALSPAQAAAVDKLYSEYFHRWPYGSEKPEPTNTAQRAIALDQEFKGGLADVHRPEMKAVHDAIVAARKAHDAQVAAALKALKERQETPPI
jgi:hypothetical protein